MTRHDLAVLLIMRRISLEPRPAIDQPGAQEKGLIELRSVVSVVSSARPFYAQLIPSLGPGGANCVERGS